MTFVAIPSILARVGEFRPPLLIRIPISYQFEGHAADGLLHLINSGPATLDGTGQQTDADGNPVMKPFWEISDEEVERCLKATTWHPSITEYFPGGGTSTRYCTRGGMPATMTAGHVGHLFITLASLFRIPVYMHNVADDQVFRPSAWSAFGTNGLEAADFRACQHFGPLYGRV